VENDVRSQLFTELKISLPETVRDYFFQRIESTEEWSWPLLNLSFVHIKHSDVVKIDCGHDFNKFIKEYNVVISILKMPPNSYIPWHIDVKEVRRCIINVPIKNYPNSYTFSVSSDGQTFKMPYTLNKMCLLNSQKFHSVFNCSDEDRYVISFHSGDLDFNGAYTYFKNINLIDNG
jgi:hypothetical protein